MRLGVNFGRQLPTNLLSDCRVSSVGERPLASAGPKPWNNLPDDLTSASSLTVFWRKLKTHLFRKSYPDIIKATPTIVGEAFIFYV